MTAFDRTWIVLSPDRCRAVGHRLKTLRPQEQAAETNQIVRSGRKGHDPIDQFATSMPQLAQAAHGLHPPKHLFDQLALALANRVSGVARRPAIDRTAGLLCDMWRDLASTPCRS